MSSPSSSNITSVLKESRTFLPPPAFSAAARVKSVAESDALCQKAKDDPIASGVVQQVRATIH